MSIFEDDTIAHGALSGPGESGGDAKHSRRKLLSNGAKVFATAALGGTGLFTATGAGAQQQNPKYGISGALAPELNVPYWIDRDGESTTFSVLEARGQWVFLKCFQNWCPGCHSSGFPTLKAFSDAFHEHPKVAIAGIQTVFEGYSSNTQSAVRKLQKRYKLPITMGHDAGDPDGDHRSDTMVKFRTGGTPWLILINPEGYVVYNDFRVDTDQLIRYVGENVA